MNIEISEIKSEAQRNFTETYEWYQTDTVTHKTNNIGLRRKREID